MIRQNYVYLITTVNKKSNSYELRIREPKTLAANQVAFKIKIEINEADWFNRIIPYDVGLVKPPHDGFIKPPKMDMAITNLLFGKSIPQQVMDRLTGK